MKRIAIIGGGISGLAAAFALEEHRRAGALLEYVLYESSPRLGGVLRSQGRVDEPLAKQILAIPDRIEDLAHRQRRRSVTADEPE